MLLRRMKGAGHIDRHSLSRFKNVAILSSPAILALSFKDIIQHCARAIDLRNGYGNQSAIMFNDSAKSQKILYRLFLSTEIMQKHPIDAIPTAANNSAELQKAYRAFDGTDRISISDIPEIKRNACYHAHGAIRIQGLTQKRLRISGAGIPIRILLYFESHFYNRAVVFHGCGIFTLAWACGP